MSLASDDFGAMFRNFARSAFRLEVHQTYTILSEADEVQLFLAGGEQPDDDDSSWHRMVRDHTAAGRTMRRVKIVRRPLTDYTRYLFAWGVPGNVEAGEDYRILDVTEREVDLPNQDFWIFDDATVVLLNFRQDGTLAGIELAEPEHLQQYLDWRDVAMSESVPYLPLKETLR